MRTATLTSFALIGVVLASAAAPTPSGWRRLLPTVSGNVAITKERAERGEVASQGELADNLTANLLVAEAVGHVRLWRDGESRHGDLRPNPDPCQPGIPERSRID